MRVAQRLLALLAALVMIGCAPEAERTMHDLYVYGAADERLTYFYGGEGSLAYEGGSIELVDAHHLHVARGNRHHPLIVAGGLGFGSL